MSPLDGFPEYEAVVIGTSAGGVEALLSLLPKLPADFPAAILAVIHLPRGRDSLLPELFAARCRLPVKEAEDKEPVTPGTIYFAPPDYHLLVDWSRAPAPGPSLALSVDEPVHFSRPSIDVLFESASVIYGPKLLGLVLTGANADGARGLQVLRKAGGTAWVQDPSAAYAWAMPRAALEAGPVDSVLSLEQMAARLRSLGRAGAM